jgi:hypothetical protein
VPGSPAGKQARGSGRLERGLGGQEQPSGRRTLDASLRYTPRRAIGESGPFSICILHPRNDDMHIPSSAQRRPVGTFKFRGDRQEWSRPADVKHKKMNDERGRPAAQLQPRDMVVRVWCREFNRQHSSHPEAASGLAGDAQVSQIRHISLWECIEGSRSTGEPTCSSSLTSASETAVAPSSPCPSYFRSVHLSTQRFRVTSCCINLDCFALAVSLQIQRPASAPNIPWKQHDDSGLRRSGLGLGRLQP